MNPSRDSLTDEIIPIKIYPPGSQPIYPNLTLNRLYYCYTSTMTAVVHSIKTNEIVSIINLSKDKYIRSIALNKGHTSEIALFYDYSIVIFDITTNSIVTSFKMSNVTFMQFNTDNQLLVISNDNLFLIDIVIRTTNKIESNGKVIKAKWYPFNSVDFACANLNSVYYFNKNNKAPLNSITFDKKYKIVDIEWYDTDENYKYLLCGFECSEIALCDIDAKNSNVIMYFEKYGNNLRFIKWNRIVPGDFFAMYKNTSRISEWNVSKRNYNKIVKWSDNIVVNAEYIDKSKLVIICESGDVFIYNIEHSTIHRTISQGHCETVFDLKFSPFLYGIFATCGYDGLIKIWNLTLDKVIATLKPVDINETDPKNKSRMYSLKWSPRDKELLLSGDSKGILRLWDINRKKQITTVSLALSEIIGIDWNVNDSIIASCNFSIYVISYEGKKLIVTSYFEIKDTKFFQIKFVGGEPVPKFAVGGSDGVIRIYSTQKITEVIIKLEGHTHKVFGLAFNPKTNLLASSSDDFRIGIWNLHKMDSDVIKPKFLIGHTNNVRQLAFMNEMNNLLVSGSWDGSTRIWNLDYMICIALINEHQSDVYGLDLSPHSPFLLATSSRDNSIRLWNYDINAFENFIDYANTTDKKLWEKYPKLNDELNKIEKNDVISRCETIAKYFLYRDYLTELFDILRISKNLKEHSNDTNNMFHVLDLISAYKSKILGLEFKYYNADDKGNSIIKKQDILKELIDYCSKCGEWEKYCELNIEIGNYKKALIAAPKVSLEYWNELVTKLSVEHQDVAMISEDPSFAIKNLSEEKQFSDALMLFIERVIKKLNKRTPGGPLALQNNDDSNIDLSSPQLVSMVAKIAEMKMQRRQIVSASCEYLSVNDYNQCIKTLVRGNECELAYMIMSLCGNKLYEFEIFSQLLLKQMKLNPKDKIIKLISNASKDTQMRLYAQYRTLLNKKVDEKILNYFISLVRETNDYYAKMVIEEQYNKILDEMKYGFEVIIKSLNQHEINEKGFLTMIKIVNALKMADILKEAPKGIHSLIVNKLITFCLFYDTLNRNLSAINIYFHELSILKKDFFDEDESFFIQIANEFYKSKRNVNLVSKMQLKITPKPNLNFRQNDYSPLFKAFDQLKNDEIKKFHCGEMKKFYYIAREKFPSNSRSNSISFFTNKIIKGKKIPYFQQTNITQAEALELIKYFYRPIIPY